MLELKNTLNLYRLRKKLLLKSAVLVVPSVATAVFIGCMYTMPPIGVCSSFLFSGFFLFFMGVVLSMTMQGRENDVFEETLLFHCQATSNYYLSREMLALYVCFIYSLVLTLYPVLLYFKDSSKFSRTMGIADVLLGGVYILICGLGGMSLGDFFHARIFKKRRDAILGAIFISVLALCKYGIIKEFSFLSILHFLLPPIMNGFELVGDKDIFEPLGMFKIYIHMLAYLLIITLIKIKLLTNKKFRY